MKKLDHEKKATIQALLGFGAAIAGLVLLYIGLFMPPAGEIDNTVLVAYGEVCTFSAGLIGIDYHYRYKNNGNSDR